MVGPLLIWWVQITLLDFGGLGTPASVAEAISPALATSIALGWAPTAASFVYVAPCQKK
jgi:hypothetical protein